MNDEQLKLLETVLRKIVFALERDYYERDVSGLTDTDGKRIREMLDKIFKKENDNNG